VVTKPLKEFKPWHAPIEIAPDPVRQKPETPRSVPEEKVDELPPFVEEVPAPEPETPATPEEPTVFTPLESKVHLSAPVSALVLAAQQDTDSGNPEAAGAAIERAIRIEPRNAILYYKLAVARLNQSQPRLAEDLAKKAALLASGDSELKKHSWLLIAKARELLSNPEGAKAAKNKADGFN
jgi:predicted Zn-dependent protease